MMEQTHIPASSRNRLPCAPAGASTALAKLPARWTRFLSRVEMKAPAPKLKGRSAIKMISNGEAVIEIDGFIGGSDSDDCWWSWEPEGKDSKTVRSELKAAGPISTVRVQLNSTGGYALEGSQIYNVLKAAAADGIRVIIEVGAACMSAATLIACAGIEVLTAKNSVWMIHEPATDVYCGQAKDLRAAADMLDTIRDASVSIYTDFNKTMDAEAVKAVMANTTYYTGEEAVAAGWATGLLHDPASDVTMALDFDALDLTNASDEVKARLEVLRQATMSAAVEVDTTVTDVVPPVVDEPPADVVDRVDAPAPELTGADVDANAGDIAEQVETLTAINAELAKRVEASKAPPAPQPELKAGPVVDMKSPAVVALQSLAKMDGRDAEFTLAVNAGSTLAQLRQRFIEALPAKAADVTNSGAIVERVPTPSTAAEVDPTDIYAEMNGTKK